MKKTIMVLIFLFLLTPGVSAEHIEISGEEFYNSTAQDIVEGKLDLNPISIINAVKDGILGEVSGIKTMLKSILLISVAAGLLRILNDAVGTKETGETAFFACFLMMSVTAVSVFSQAV